MISNVVIEETIPFDDGDTIFHLQFDAEGDRYKAIILYRNKSVYLYNHSIQIQDDEGEFQLAFLTSEPFDQLWYGLEEYFKNWG